MAVLANTNASTMYYTVTAFLDAHASCTTVIFWDGDLCMWVEMEADS